ncbi:hypothetical protein CNBG_10016 [Cryptococcus deuterogattii R265]|uniref:uncharacterized protein n=1 Tax=Cryptococcus deuterogattii (strain R265) TaxID=294750 RepID=UPI001935914E|nr:hypothetical protein CNBG_10016 [Cryptococcus deuterogattii R265]
MDERSFLPNSLQLLQADGAVVVRAVGSHSQALRKKGNGADDAGARGGSFGAERIINERPVAQIVLAVGLAIALLS